MSKTELLNPIAKYYIIDSQYGYKQNVSLEQNRIQKLEKMFSRGEPDVLCPASGVGEGDLPPAPLSRPALSLPMPRFALRAASRMVLRGCLCFMAGFLGDSCCPGQAAGCPGRPGLLAPAAVVSLSAAESSVYLPCALVALM